MQLHGINFDNDAIAAFCRRHDVLRFSLFGSIVTDKFGSGSDIDVLVEFPPRGGPGLLGFAAMEIELSTLFGREVHLHTPAMLGPLYRLEVEPKAMVQYAA
ncbi:MAG TPA: nucleotidyltransferase domain-containing protein [Phycisphaerales bacterium]|nr:nucleotidyltransferase domain-containing protein [Phycisphaerales bacterium]